MDFSSTPSWKCFIIRRYQKTILTIPGAKILVIMAANFELGHNEWRSRICVCCYQKTDRPLSEKDIACIQLNLVEGYNVDNPDFPNGICSGCHLELSKKSKSDQYCQDTCKRLQSKTGKRFAFCCKMWMPNLWGCQDARHNIPAHDEEKARNTKEKRCSCSS